MKYNSTALHSSTAKERCKPRGRIDRNKGKVGNRIKSIAGKPADQPRIRLLVACLPQRQVVYAGSGVRVSHTDAVLPFASLIWPNHGRQPPLEDAAATRLADLLWKHVQLNITCRPSYPPVDESRSSGWFFRHGIFGWVDSQWLSTTNCSGNCCYKFVVRLLYFWIGFFWIVLIVVLNLHICRI